jgi:hypothetical protein
MAHNLDIFPTICELAGAKVPADRKIDGKSLIPQLTGKTTETPHERLFQQWTRVKPDADQNWMARDKRWKLVNGELFDLESDPGETKNVAEAQPEIVDRLRADYGKWFGSVIQSTSPARPVIEVGREDENPVEIDVMWADLQSDLKPVGRRYIRDTIEGWNDKSGSASWRLDVVQPGTYQVLLHWGQDSQGGRQAMIGSFDKPPIIPPSAGFASLRAMPPHAQFQFETQSTGGKEVYKLFAVATVKLSQGPTILSIQGVKGANPQGFALHKVWLKRVGQ